MKIHLIRHAKTAQNSETGFDFDRKLLPKGIVQANVLASYLLTHEVKPVCVFCSDAVRTKETMEILQHTNQIKEIHYSNDFYLCEREIYLKTIWNLKHGKDLLFLGHNDGLSEFASYLTETFVSLKTGEYMCINFTTDKWNEVSRGTGTILDQFRPTVYL